jgi:hypothetical protein
MVERISDRPLSSGENVTITSAPPELLNGLPHKDQEDIRSFVGKPGVLVGVDNYGFAEIEFNAPPHTYRMIFVDMLFVVRFPAPR